MLTYHKREREDVAHRAGRGRKFSGETPEGYGNRSPAESPTFGPPSVFSIHEGAGVQISQRVTRFVDIGHGLEELGVLGWS